MNNTERCILEKAKCKLEKTRRSPIGKLATAYVKTAIALRDYKLARVLNGLNGLTIK